MPENYIDGDGLSGIPVNEPADGNAIKDGAHEIRKIRQYLHDQTAGPTVICPVGAIIAFPKTTGLPQGWTLCDGGTLTRDQPLFNVIGEAFGSGDGSTTFNVPDLRRKFIMGAGGVAAWSGSGAVATTVGSTGGSESVTLTTNQLPAHKHEDLTFVASHGDDGDPGDSIIIDSLSDNPSKTISGITTGETGGGEAHLNLPPTIVLAYIIRYR